MRKNLLLFCAFLLCSASVVTADTNPLYEEFSRAKETKVFVKTPEDSGAAKLDGDHFKTAIENALKERKSVHFSIAPAETDAQLVVESDVKGFLFSLTDPVDMLAGVGMAAADAAKIDHFAAADIRFTVRDTAGKTRWEEVLHASITDEKFTEAEAREQILGRAADIFVRSAFGKKK